MHSVSDATINPLHKKRADGQPLRQSSSKISLSLILGALTLCVLEGAARKWLIGSESNIAEYGAYFSKDIIFAGLLLLSPLAKRNLALLDFKRWLVPGCALVLCGAIVSSIFGFNPVGAVLTLRAMLVLPFLTWLVARRLNQKHLLAIAILTAVFTIANFGLGLVQTQLSTDHILNKYANENMFVVEVSAGVRACGTFAYITGMSVMSTAGIWAGLTLMSLSRSIGGKGLGSAAVIAGFGCGLVSFSRAPIVIGAAMVVVWLLAASSGIKLIFRASGAIVLVCLLGWALGFAPVFQRLATGLLERQEEVSENGESSSNRMFGQLEEAAEAAAYVPFGNGLGTEQVAATFLSTGRRGFNNFETQFPRIILDTGIIGFIGFVVIYGGLILVLQNVKRRTSDEGRRGMLLATQLFVAGIAYTNVIYNHTASSMMWIIIAAVLGSASAKNVKSKPVRTPKR
jgi:hypothetical protein